MDADGTATPLFDRSEAVLSPDGRQIVFLSDRAGAYNLYRVAADGSGPVERLTTSDNEQYPNSITPDGTTVLTVELRPIPPSGMATQALATHEQGAECVHQRQHREHQVRAADGQHVGQPALLESRVVRRVEKIETAVEPRFPRSPLTRTAR